MTSKKSVFIEHSFFLAINTNFIGLNSNTIKRVVCSMFVVIFLQSILVVYSVIFGLASIVIGPIDLALN